MKPVPESKSRCPAWLPPLLGLAAFLPFLSQYGYFRQLYYFGDEFPLISEINTQPFGHWLWYPFVENILPLFKLLWGGAIVKGSGAYLDLLWAGWIVHAGTTGLMAAWMRRAGFGWSSVAVCVSLFAWSASQVETLTWTVQISSELATLFFVAGALMLPAETDDRFSGRQLFGMALFSTASAWSFSRGLLTGPVLGFTLLVALSRAGGVKKWLGAALCVLPTLATGLLMMKAAPENSRHLASELSHWRAVVGFALCYLGGGPVLPYWFTTEHGSAFNVSEATVVVVGTLKLVVLVLAWRWATIQQRRVLLLPALLLELGYAALLGLGRWEGDWHYGMGSRYQYNSLLCSLPFAGVWLERWLAHPTWSFRRAVRLTTALVVLFGAYSFYGWSREMPVWGEWRGLRNRHLLVGVKSVPDGANVESLPGFPNARAKQLVDAYHLH